MVCNCIRTPAQCPSASGLTADVTSSCSVCALVMVVSTQKRVSGVHCKTCRCVPVPQAFRARDADYEEGPNFNFRKQRQRKRRKIGSAGQSMMLEKYQDDVRLESRSLAKSTAEILGQGNENEQEAAAKVRDSSRGGLRAFEADMGSEGNDAASQRNWIVAGNDASSSDEAQQPDQEAFQDNATTVYVAGSACVANDDPMEAVRKQGGGETGRSVQRSRESHRSEIEESVFETAVSDSSTTGATVFDEEEDGEDDEHDFVEGINFRWEHAEIDRGAQTDDDNAAVLAIQTCGSTNLNMETCSSANNVSVPRMSNDVWSGISSTSTTTASPYLTPPRAPSCALISPGEALSINNRLTIEASARRSSLHTYRPKTMSTWITHARSATVNSVMQTLQGWLRAARHHGRSSQHLEVPPLVRSSPATAATADDLALAVRAFRLCERATAICGQAVLCRRLCYANLYRLNERAREQSVQGLGCRSQLFNICYPEFARPDGNLKALTGEARTALSRLSRDIHFGGAICHFADRFPCAEAILLLQPSIPDRFLRKLTAAQLDAWADMVLSMVEPTRHILGCLWKATTMIVNQAIDLQTHLFPLEHVLLDGSWFIDFGTTYPSSTSVEHLLTPVLCNSSRHVKMQTNPASKESTAYLSGPSLMDTPAWPSSPAPVVRHRAWCCTGEVDVGSPATDSSGSEPCIERRNEGGRTTEMPDLEMPSSVYGGRNIWEESDSFSQAVGEVNQCARDPAS